MRVGAVGVGAHAVNAILPNLPVAGLTLAATCARHLDRAQTAAARFGARLAFDDVDRMLDEVALDGVVVVVPVDQFAPVIRACIARGVPVFAEKPAANDASEAQQLVDEAAALLRDDIAEMPLSEPLTRSGTACLGHGACRARTGDLRLAKPTLSQLS
jgi:predicted dehydrogenase